MPLLACSAGYRQDVRLDGDYPACMAGGDVQAQDGLPGGPVFRD
ncbi:MULTISPECIES: hypothetical protein [unclassified Eikenella]|nr:MULTISPECIES: hypothetical protein [unclassified Eikenella]